MIAALVARILERLLATLSAVAAAKFDGYKVSRRTRNPAVIPVFRLKHSARLALPPSSSVQLMTRARRNLFTVSAFGTPGTRWVSSTSEKI